MKQLLLQGDTASCTTHSWTSTSGDLDPNLCGHPASSQMAFVHYLALTNSCQQVLAAAKIPHRKSLSN